MMTTVPLHRAETRTLKRYKSTSTVRRRHHAGIVEPVAKARTETVFAIVMFSTLLACWMLIFGVLMGMSVKIPVVSTKQPDTLEIFKQPAFGFGNLAELDPSIRLFEYQISTNTK